MFESLLYIPLEDGNHKDNSVVHQKEMLAHGPALGIYLSVTVKTFCQLISSIVCTLHWFYACCPINICQYVPSEIAHTTSFGEEQVCCQLQRPIPLCWQTAAGETSTPHPPSPCVILALTCLQCKKL